jgi:hypothetical protein
MHFFILCVVEQKKKKKEESGYNSMIYCACIKKLVYCILHQLSNRYHSTPPASLKHCTVAVFAGIIIEIASSIILFTSIPHVGMLSVSAA